jgi:hypothetical protein
VTRLRGHATIIGLNSTGREGVAMAKVGRVICAMLGGNWAGPPVAVIPGTHVCLVFYAGRTCEDSGIGVRGALVIKTHITGSFQVSYMCEGVPSRKLASSASYKPVRSVRRPRWMNSPGLA